VISIFFELFLSARERIEQPQLRLGRQQRLVIVRPMKIDELIPEIFQDRQRRWRTVNELSIGSSGGESPLQDQIVLTRFDSCVDKLWIQFLQIVSAKNRFHHAKIGPGPNQ
jgi:hypothetical protein